MRQSRSRQSRNELTHPSAPISGNTLMNLKLVLESVVGDGEVRDLDLAMLLNVPVNRLGRLKKAGAPAGTAETPEPDDEQDDAAAATIRPNQAILVRLLLKHPEYAPLTMRPGNAEMFELIAPLMPGTGSNGKMAGKQGYAPLFGRSYVSSYKMLAEAESTSLPVVRLQLLIVGRLGEMFRELCLKKVQQAAQKVPDYVLQSLKHDAGWQLLRARDSLTDWMPDVIFEEFSAELLSQWRTWFNECYLTVLRDEALSRDLDPNKVMLKGNWTNRKNVEPADLQNYDRATQPILGCEDSLFSIFRESFGLTSAEAFWVLGLQVKAFYRFRQRARQRIDAPSALLVRYLFRYPDDIRHIIPAPPSGESILQSIQQDDPAFRTSQLGPMFGASRVMSYEFVADQHSSPFFARRLATIYAEQKRRGQPIYAQLRQCVEDELKARGLDSREFWRDGRWNP